MHCKHAAGHDMDDVTKLKQNNVEDYFQKLCTIMNDYLRCCQPFVHEKCGNEAWKLVGQV